MTLLNESRQLRRFAAIGSLGFLIDAGLLTALVNGMSWGHYTARALSFSLAVSATWYCNRRWVFQPTANRSSEYARYAAVQIGGAVLNLSIYVAAIEWIPPLAAWPVIPLALGAAVSMGFNFVLSRALVFAGSAEQRHRATP